MASYLFKVVDMTNVQIIWDLYICIWHCSITQVHLTAYFKNLSVHQFILVLHGHRENYKEKDSSPVEEENCVGILC